MNINLSNKNIILTGGTTGIGKATVELFASSGANVLFCARSEESGNKLAANLTESLNSKGMTNQVLFSRVSVDDENAVKGFVETAIDKFGSIDYAVNNAGVRGTTAPLHECTSEDWDNMMDVNLKGVFYSLKYELAQMLKQQKSEAHAESKDLGIVNISSVYGTGGSALGLGPYHVAKYGVIGLTTTAATEYAKFGIRVNAVCPGWVAIEATEDLDESFIEHVSKSHPLQRIATPEEVAKSIVFLCSDASSFTTGHSLLVDGGISAKRDPGLS